MSEERNPRTSIRNSDSSDSITETSIDDLVSAAAILNGSNSQEVYLYR